MMTNKEDLFLAYPVVGLIFAIVLVVTGNLGEGTPLSGKGGSFVMAVWLWPVFLIALVGEWIVDRRKR